MDGSWWLLRGGLPEPVTPNVIIYLAKASAFHICKENPISVSLLDLPFSWFTLYACPVFFRVSYRVQGFYNCWALSSKGFLLWRPGCTVDKRGPILDKARMRGSITSTCLADTALPSAHNETMSQRSQEAGKQLNITGLEEDSKENQCPGGQGNI